MVFDKHVKIIRHRNDICLWIWCGIDGVLPKCKKFKRLIFTTQLSHLIYVNLNSTFFVMKSQPYLGLLRSLMTFFKEMYSRIEISYKTMMLLCFIYTLFHCLLDVCSDLLFWSRTWNWTNLSTLYSHIPTDTMTLCHMHHKTSGQDLVYGLWPQNRAKLNDHTQDQSLWPQCLSSDCKPASLNESFLSALCMSNVFQRKLLTIYSQAAAVERILHFLHSTLPKESSQLNHSLLDC